MTNKSTFRHPFPSQLAALLLASAIVPALAAQQAQPTGTTQSAPASIQSAPIQSAPSSTAQQQPATSPSASAAPAKEGFWGRVYPFARKKWVKRQTDPINDRLGELDELNAKNANDIRDVDSRAQAGIRQAQSTADAANQAATAAGAQAQQAGNMAQGADIHVNQLNSTVNGLDQYKQVTEAEVTFHGGQPVLSAAARKQLDDLAASVTGRKGYILEVEAHSPAAGSVGIQNSERLAAAVKRYLVTEHQIPVYRLHSVALGNAQIASAGDEGVKPVRTSTVHIRLMENSLAAQEDAPPDGAASSTGTERP
jgi:outer membrane protein OmpA-like peptidoglycan-associated protein